jgi:pSer/pThr/pTyr-binding forkhead associated (FHA) protein
VERLAAERTGEPFLIHHDQRGAQVITPLVGEPNTLTIGRARSNPVCLEWDDSVSRVHAELVRLGEAWAVVDDGVSRNGSFVNGERVSGRRRLRDGDAIRVGKTVILYRRPSESDTSLTASAHDLPSLSTLSPAQRRVLIALARPFRDESGIVTPATNQEIAHELYLSVDAVKTHLRALGVKFGVQDLPQNQKRSKLVERAFNAGVITRRDLQ